jgi:hypothetical protein
MMRGVSTVAALAAVATAWACSKDSTGPGGGSSGYTGTYTGIIAGATTSGTLTITIPAATAAAPARVNGEYLIDAVVTLTGSLKISGGSTYPISGSFDTSTGLLSGVTAGPYAISGGFVGGKFTGTWTNTGAGTAGGFSLLSVPSGGSALALCGVFTGADNGVWNLTIVGTSMVGEAANGSGALRLSGTFSTATDSMTNITSPDDATVLAKGLLVTATSTAAGVWAGGGGTGNWAGSAAACN